MATTTFLPGTVIASTWLNDVNTTVYSGSVNLRLYGAVGDGTTDDTVAVQNAVTAAQASGVELFVPAGNYKVTTINVTNHLKLRGAGRQIARFTTTSTTANMFNVVSDAGFEISDLWLQGSAVATAGALIALTGSATHNAYSKARDMIFSGGFNQFYTTSALLWTIDNCIFSGFVQYGVGVQNLYNADAGDSCITNSTFSNASAARACVWQASSGGLKLVGNKFNTAQYGYLLELAGVTSDLIVVGNSFENSSLACMAFSYTSGSFNNIEITGNQFALSAAGILMNNTAAFFSIATISGNTFSAMSQYGILVDNASNVNISGNTIIGNSGLIGLKLFANVNNATIGGNKIAGFTTSILNLSNSFTIKTYPLLVYNGGSIDAGNTSENILATCTIPAGAMGLNGGLKIFSSWSCTNNANVKTMRVRLGGISGALLWSAAPTTSSYLRSTIYCGNAGVTNSQTVTLVQEGDATVLSQAPFVLSVDTTPQLTIVFTGQKANAGDALTLHNAWAELQV